MHGDGDGDVNSHNYHLYNVGSTNDVSLSVYAPD